MLWHLQAFDALLFDCDGTLADTMPSHFRAWQRVTAAHGLDFGEDAFYGSAGRPTREIAAGLARAAGIEIDIERAAVLKEEAFLAELDSVRAIDPVVDVVHRARGRVPLAVVTGGYRKVCLKILEHVGVAEAFDTIVACEDTARHKPEPDPFLEAARRLKARPERCVVWEDSDLGIEAARRAGMTWIDVRSFHEPARSGA